MSVESLNDKRLISFQDSDLRGYLTPLRQGKEVAKIYVINKQNKTKKNRPRILLLLKEITRERKHLGFSGAFT